MINKNLTYAVVGASNNLEKYGYQVFKDLLQAGFRVIPINPKLGKILEEKVYPTLSAYKQKIDLVIFVVPPVITQKVLKEVNNLKIKKVWLQPGSESSAAIEFCRQHKIDCVHGACIMFERRQPQSNY